MVQTQTLVPDTLPYSLRQASLEIIPRPCRSDGNPDPHHTPSPG